MFVGCSLLLRDFFPHNLIFINVISITVSWYGDNMLLMNFELYMIKL